MNQVNNAYNRTVREQLGNLVSEQNESIQVLYPESTTPNTRDSQSTSIYGRLKVMSAPESGLPDSLSALASFFYDLNSPQSLYDINYGSIEKPDQIKGRLAAVERVCSKLLNSQPVIECIQHVKELTEALLGQKPFSEICPES